MLESVVLQLCIFGSYKATENGNSAGDVSSNRIRLRVGRDYQQHNPGDWKDVAK